MTTGRAGSDLGIWHTGAACSIECEGTMEYRSACGILASRLTLPQARSKARAHARRTGHYVTIEYPRFQTVHPPKKEAS